MTDVSVRRHDFLLLGQWLTRYGSFMLLPVGDVLSQIEAIFCGGYGSFFSNTLKKIMNLLLARKLLYRFRATIGVLFPIRLRDLSHMADPTVGD